MPELTIIMPMLIESREKIPAIESVRKQDFEDYEIL